MRDDKREEGTEGGAHEPLENGLCQSAAAGAGDRATAGVAEQSLAGGHQSVNHSDGGACLVAARINVLRRWPSSSESQVTDAHTAASTHASEPADTAAVLWSIRTAREQSTATAAAGATATATGGGSCPATGCRSGDGGRDGLWQIPGRSAGRPGQSGQFVAVYKQSGYAGLPAAVVQESAGNGGRCRGSEHAGPDDAADDAPPVLVSTDDGTGGATGGR